MAGGHNKRGRQGFGVLLPKADEHNLGGTEVDVLRAEGVWRTGVMLGKRVQRQVASIDIEIRFWRARRYEDGKASLS